MNKEYSFTDEHIEQYRQEGFVVERLFGANYMLRVDPTIRQMTDQALSGDDYSKVFELQPDPVGGQRIPQRIVNPCDQDGAFGNFALDPQVGSTGSNRISPAT